MSRQASSGKITIRSEKYLGSETGHRQWLVAVAINNGGERIETLKDHLKEEEYEQRAHPGSEQHLTDNELYEYFENIYSQLKLEDPILSTTPNLHISIQDFYGNQSSNHPSIHSLLWETFERTDFWLRSTNWNAIQGQEGTVRLCRTLHACADRSSSLKEIQRQQSTLVHSRKEYRIILVVARSFRRNFVGRYIDYPANLIRGSLIRIALNMMSKKMSPRLWVEVVRPGTFQELEKHLRSEDPGSFDMIHLDLHGRLKEDPSSQPLPAPAQPPLSKQSLTPYLRFAKPFDPDLRLLDVGPEGATMPLLSDDSLEDVKVSEVASLLKERKISKIALSSCFSSYAQGSMMLNMSQVFISNGASHVSAMSHGVLERTAQTFYDALYEAHFIGGQTFQSAAKEGRAALRQREILVPSLHDALIPTTYHDGARSLSNDIWRQPRIGIRKLIYRPMKIAFSIRDNEARYHPKEQASDQPLNRKTKKQRAVDEFDIEHLVIEDRLKHEATFGSIYLCSQEYPKELSSCMRHLAKIWSFTGFIDHIGIIPAEAFQSNLSVFEPWLRLQMSTEKSDSKCTYGRRRMLIVDRFDKFHPEKPEELSEIRCNNLKQALRRMASFTMKHYPPRNSYLIITGRYHKNWWKSHTWFNDPDLAETLGKAVAHDHNIMPTIFHE